MSIKPKARRRIAFWFVVVTVVVGWPVSWFLPDIDTVLATKMIMWWSALALTATGIDWWSTSDVRAEGSADE